MTQLANPVDPSQNQEGCQIVCRQEFGARLKALRFQLLALKALAESGLRQVDELSRFSDGSDQGEAEPQESQ